MDDIIVDKSGMKNQEGAVSLQSLSELTGFPLDVIKKELFLESEISDDDLIPIGKLRELMLGFIDKTLLQSSLSDK